MRSAWSVVAGLVGVGAIAAVVAIGAGSFTGGDRVDPSRTRSDAAAAPALAGATDRAARAYANLPVSFVENKGQTDARARYYAQGSGFGFYLTPDEVRMSFADERKSRDLALALRFVDHNARAVPSGAERQPGSVNYLRGADPGDWQTGLASYRQVVYRDLWPKIDLRLHEQTGVLKYEFRVHPGGRPSDIRLAYAGARGIRLDRSGGMLIDTALGALRDSAPVSYQLVGGARVPVESRYLLDGTAGREGDFAFAVNGYRPDRELIIDPGVEYTTFLGGPSHETGNGIAVDGSGDAFVTGTTQSPQFPTTPGAFRRTGAASNASDVFVSKLNPAGTALVYSTFLGGSDLDFGRRIAIDAAGNAYVAGETKSSNFPTTGGAFDRTFNIPGTCPRCGIDNYDGFVTKLNAAGSGLAYSTFLGGTDIDSPRGIAVDGSGSAYVTGETLSGDFPTTAGAFRRTNAGNYDVFVTKLNPTGSALTYSTFLGGAQVDNGERIAVDAGGNAYAMGFTSATDFPTTPGAFDTTANGAFDVFVTKLNAAGSGLVYSTFLGGEGFDTGGGLAVDAGGRAYVSGQAGSLSFPTTAGAFDRASDGDDAFVTKLNAQGSALAFSTLIGGSSGEIANAVAPDATGNAWLTGVTASGDFPVTAGAADGSPNGSADAFISELSGNGSQLLYSTYLGGAQSEAGNDLARGATGDVYVTGHTYSMDFPATVGAFDTVFNGDLSIFWGDAFVTKLSLTRTTSTPPAPPPVPTAPALVAPSNADTPPQPITFDWNDVPSAASYTIQIDDSSAFSAPLVRSESVATSIYATTGLATTTHFWRVRGVNSLGQSGAWSAVRSFTPQTSPAPAALTNLDINPVTVVGGDASSGTVILSTGAPFGGAVISLSSSNPAVASVPATVTAPANSFTGLFTVSTSAVSTSTTVVITASYNGSTRTGSLTVTPPASEPPPATLQSVAASPASVTGGANSQGIVTLSGGAPQGGALVALSSSNSAVTVPASVTVAAGAAMGFFTISSSAVSATTSVTISATYAGVTRVGTISVTPSAPPPQTATLTVTATGRGGERVTSTPSGINVPTGSSGSASFATDTSIRLSASNGRSVIWSGACSSGGQKTSSCTFTLSGAAAVTANVQ